MGGGFGPHPEYSGRRFWASARVLWEGFLDLSQSSLGGGFGPHPEYSGRRFWAPARVLWERVLGLSQSNLAGGFGPEQIKPLQRKQSTKVKIERFAKALL